MPACATHDRRGTWAEARREATRIRPTMFELAGTPHGKGATVAVLVSNGTLMAERRPAIVPALFPLFEDRASCSARLGAAKPSSAAYLCCLEALAVPPAAALLIDGNVAGARAAGLAGHRFVDLPGLRQTLGRYGLA